MVGSGKMRLDRLLLERGWAETRQKAQGMILAGEILVNGEKVEKSGAPVPHDAALTRLGSHPQYVSRGGLKLEEALNDFGIEVRGKLCLDVGASTGGFTDCLLQRGAVKVYAVDVGTHQLDWRLRSDPRVRSLEKTNARTLEFEQIGAKVDLATLDVSFISATWIVPRLPALLKSGADLVVLVKPQFEVGRGQVGKGGIVREAGLHQQAVAKVSNRLEELGFQVAGPRESSTRGAEGNREFFLHARWPNRRGSAIFTSG